jgi:hypothetical protein
MRRLLAVVLLLAACDDDNGPNSEHCVEVRMRWLELDYQRRSALAAGDGPTASRRALAQDLIVSGDMPCFPGFMLTTQ